MVNFMSRPKYIKNANICVKYNCFWWGFLVLKMTTSLCNLIPPVFNFLSNLDFFLKPRPISLPFMVVIRIQITNTRKLFFILRTIPIVANRCYYCMWRSTYGILKKMRATKNKTDKSKTRHIHFGGNEKRTKFRKKNCWAHFRLWSSIELSSSCC